MDKIIKEVKKIIGTKEWTPENIGKIREKFDCDNEEIYLAIMECQK